MSNVRVSKATAEFLLREYAEALDTVRTRGRELSAAFESMNIMFGTDRHPQVMRNAEDSLDNSLVLLSASIDQVQTAIGWAKKEGSSG